MSRAETQCQRTYHTGDEQRFEWIFGSWFDLARIPHGDFTFQFVRNLFGLLLAASLQTLFTRFDASRWRCVFWILWKQQQKSNKCQLIDVRRTRKWISLPQMRPKNSRHPNNLSSSFHGAIYRVVVEMAMDRVERTMPTNLVANTASFFQMRAFHSKRFRFSRTTLARFVFFFSVHKWIRRCFFLFIYWRTSTAWRPFYLFHFFNTNARPNFKIRQRRDDECERKKKLQCD